MTYCLELVYCNNYFNFAEIFLWLFKIKANQKDFPRIKHMFLMKFWWLRSANHEKSLEKCLICTDDIV